MKMLNVTQITQSLARMALVACPGVLALATAGSSFAADGEFKNFTQTLPGSTVKFDMIAIPTGEITVGSPADEPGRDKFDQAPKKAAVKRFWMGKCEVTWDEFLPYVFIDQSQVSGFTNKVDGIFDKDGISHPTKPYGSVYRDRGEKGANPAIGMGWPTANNYCQWLSKKTGRHYRLPTEQEWEYACRAGSTTAYFWGKDAAQAKEYGWFKDNSKEVTHLVGKLKPNAFGLYDIVGNVGEWCAKADAKGQKVLRGGAWTEEVTKLRSASRMVETEEWNENDPQSPQSVWWLSAADFTGFRVVCDEEGATAAAAAPAPAAAVVAAKPDAPAVAAVAAVAEGKGSKEIYAAQCKGCHGATGKGDTKIGQKNGARDYSSQAVKDAYNEAQWIKSITDGVEKDGKTIMHGYKDKLSAEEIKGLAQYLKGI